MGLQFNFPLVVSLLVLSFLPGCTQSPPAPTTSDAPHVHCEDQPFTPRILFLAEGHTLANTTGPAASTPGNDVRETFVSEPQPWDSQPLAEGIQLNGSVEFELWVRIDGAAPVSSQPGSSLRFILQAGSDRALSSGTAWEEGPAFSAPGTIVHLNLSLPLPEGGFTIEAGQKVRLLAASLVAGSQGTTILHGGDTPSQMRVQARCSEAREWLPRRDLAFPVILPSSQGSFTQAVPPQEGVNRMTTTFTLEEGTSRLTIALRQASNPRIKSDMDVTLLDGQDKVLYEAYSPFANETLVLWPENVAALLQTGGTYKVVVDSYSGNNYSGKLTIRMEGADEHID